MFFQIENILHDSRDSLRGPCRRTSSMSFIAIIDDKCQSNYQFAGFFLPKVGYSDSFFYSSIALIFSTILYVIFICPESLPPVEQAADTNVHEAIPHESKASPVVAAKALVSHFFKSLLSPILMFAPRRLPGSRKLQFWMPLVGMALFVYLVSIVSTY